MNKKQDRPRRLAGFGTRRARGWRRQGAGETSGHEANPGPLDDRAPRQRVIEFFHGVLQPDAACSDEACVFCDFYAALQRAHPALELSRASLRVLANPAVSRKPRCAAVCNKWTLPSPQQPCSRQLEV